ncbi:MAG: CPBP family intramembrane metalloprotease [Planctomycetales bacterium]|nr:CPBP family intramembrane metalloprotease [Planctomycetales bacterium]
MTNFDEQESADQPEPRDTPAPPESVDGEPDCPNDVETAAAEGRVVTNRATPGASFVNVTIAFEAGLGVVAIFFGWLVGFAPLGTLRIHAWSDASRPMLIGLVGTLPMLVGLVLMDRYPVGRLRGLKDLVEKRLSPLFRAAGLPRLFLISAAAGWGEELLFRGLIQAGLIAMLSETWGSPTAIAFALLVASILFGMCHWLSTMYLVIATAMGFYFGGLMLWADSLLAPIVTHALYDFAALVYLVHWKSRGR